MGLGQAATSEPNCYLPTAVGRLAIGSQRGHSLGNVNSRWRPTTSDPNAATIVWCSHALEVHECDSEGLRLTLTTMKPDRNFS